MILHSWEIWRPNYHSTSLINFWWIFFNKCACKYLKYTTYIKCILTVTYFYTTRYNIWIFIAKHIYIQTWFVIIAMIVQCTNIRKTPTAYLLICISVYLCGSETTNEANEQKLYQTNHTPVISLCRFDRSIFENLQYISY